MTDATPAEGSRLRRRLETPLLILTALVLAFLIKTFLVQAFFIPSGSMLETLQVGDRVLVEKVTERVREPRRGEILVFHRPGVDRSRGPGAVVRDLLQGLGLVQPDADIDLIKRLVALGGETIEVRDGVVRIDGVAIDEPYVAGPTADFGPYEVPEDHLFFLGDNRGNSDDSRFSLGAVPRAEVVGRAFVVIWPPAGIRLLTRPETRVAAGAGPLAPVAGPPVGGPIDAAARAWLPWPPDASASTFALPPHVPGPALRRPTARRLRTTPPPRTLNRLPHEPHRPRRRRASP